MPKLKKKAEDDWDDEKDLEDPDWGLLPVEDEDTWIDDFFALMERLNDNAVSMNLIVLGASFEIVIPYWMILVTAILMILFW